MARSSSEPAGRGKLIATLCVAISACCFGSIAIFSLLGTRGGTPLTTLLVGRYTLAVVVLGAIVTLRGMWKLSGARAMELVLFYGAAQAAVTVLSLSALAHIPAAMMSFLFYTYPAIVAVVGALTRTDPLSPMRIVALMLSLSGIVLMVGSPWTMQSSITGVVLAVGAGAVYAIYGIALNRRQSDVPPAVATTLISLGAAFFCLVYGFITDEITLSPDVGAVAAILALGLVSTVVAFLLFMKGLAELGPMRTAIVSTIEPFWTAVIGALVLAQPLTPQALAGGALIACAVILLQLVRDRSLHSEQPTPNV